MNKNQKDLLPEIIKLISEITTLKEEVRAISSILAQNQKKGELMTVKSLCAHLEYSPAAIYSKVSRNEIPHYQEPNGRKLFFDSLEIENWIKGNSKT